MKQDEMDRRQFQTGKVDKGVQKKAPQMRSLVYMENSGFEPLTC